MTTLLNGAVLQERRYYAYGNKRSGSDFAFEQEYTGQRRDATGLIYYNARYYDPYMGLFISPDPLIPDPTDYFSYNRYLYARANPLKYHDPTGHQFGIPWHMVPTWGQQLASACATSSWCQTASNWTFNAAPVWIAENAPLLGTWADKIPAWFNSSGPSTPSSIPGSSGGNTAGPGGLDPNDRFTKLLQNISPNTWQSPAGLRYGPDPLYGNRIDHVLRHTVDDLSRPSHGVFTVGQNDVLPLLDDAWSVTQKALTSPSTNSPLLKTLP